MKIRPMSPVFLPTSFLFLQFPEDIFSVLQPGTVHFCNCPYYLTNIEKNGVQESNGAQILEPQLNQRSSSIHPLLALVNDHETAQDWVVTKQRKRKRDKKLPQLLWSFMPFLTPHARTTKPLDLAMSTHTKDSLLGFWVH